jgi:hypothetical protein
MIGALVLAWFFNLDSGTILGERTVSFPLDTIGPFGSERDCSTVRKMWMHDQEFMDLVNELGAEVGHCYPLKIPEAEMKYKFVLEPGTD